MTRAARCSCGGILRQTTAKKVDLEPLFGLKGDLVGAVHALRCSQCGSMTYEAATFARMLGVVARCVLEQPRILTADEARFVRKAVLGFTQDRLARRMGIHKITVADWERGERALSKEHDYELRGIAVARLLSQRSDMDRGEREALTRSAEEILSAPRTEAPPKHGRRHVIKSSGMAAA